MAVEVSLFSTLTPSGAASHSPAFLIRKATIEDLDAIVDVALAAMPLDPQWNWRFPYRGQYPEDERLFTRTKFEEFLLSEDRWLVMVVEIPYDGGATVLVAFSIWDLVNVFALVQQIDHKRGLNHATSHYDLPTIRRDGHPERMEAWSRVTAGAKQRLFNRHYGANYIQLQILGTLPQWQRKGAATALCSWGLQLAAILRFHVTVLASPMGKQLYTKLGFRKLAAVNVCAGQGDSGVTLTAMALEPRIIG